MTTTPTPVRAGTPIRRTAPPFDAAAERRRGVAVPAALAALMLIALVLGVIAGLLT
jgi:hypothetical protein